MHLAPLAAWNSLISAKVGEWWLATPGSREKVGIRCPVCHRDFTLALSEGRQSMWDVQPRVNVDPATGVISSYTRTFDGASASAYTVRCPHADCYWEDTVQLAKWSAQLPAPKFAADRPDVASAGNKLRAQWV